MLNTGNASTPLTDIYTLEVNVKLKNVISVPSVTDGLDFFIAYQGIGQKRTEVHLTHFNSATANGQLADNEVLEVIKAVNNLGLFAFLINLLSNRNNSDNECIF